MHPVQKRQKRANKNLSLSPVSKAVSAKPMVKTRVRTTAADTEGVTMHYSEITGVENTSLSCWRVDSSGFCHA
jgi:hypothetical protein